MNKGDTGSVGSSSYLSGDPPSVTRGVFHPAAAVGVAFPALRLIDRDTTGLQGALVGGIHIGHVNVQPHGEGRVVAPAVGDHHHRVVDLYLGVHDRTVGPLVASCLPGVERFDQKVYDALRSLGHYVRRDARIPFRLVRAIHRAFLPLSRRRRARLRIGTFLRTPYTRSSENSTSARLGE